MSKTEDRATRQKAYPLLKRIVRCGLPHFRLLQSGAQLLQKRKVFNKRTHFFFYEDLLHTALSLRTSLLSPRLSAAASFALVA